MIFRKDTTQVTLRKTVTLVCMMKTWSTFCCFTDSICWDESELETSGRNEQKGEEGEKSKRRHKTITWTALIFNFSRQCRLFVRSLVMKNNTILKIQLSIEYSIGKLFKNKMFKCQFKLELWSKHSHVHKLCIQGFITSISALYTHLNNILFSRKTSSCSHHLSYLFLYADNGLVSVSWTMFRRILSVLMSHVAIKILNLSDNYTYFLKGLICLRPVLFSFAQWMKTYFWSPSKGIKDK